MATVVAIAAIWSMPDIEGESIDLGGAPVEAYRAIGVDAAPPPPDPNDKFSGYGEVLVRIAEGPRQGERLRAFVTLQSTDAGPEDLLTATRSSSRSPTTSKARPSRP